MEDLFKQFRAWLKSSNGTLDELSPAASEQAERDQQLMQAKVNHKKKQKTLAVQNIDHAINFLYQAVIEDVETHREALNKLGAAVKVVSELVDEDDKQLLGGQLDEVTGQYNTLKFNSNGYPVERWLEDKEMKLCLLAPTGVLVSPVQVC